MTIKYISEWNSSWTESNPKEIWWLILCLARLVTQQGHFPAKHTHTYIQTTLIGDTNGIPMSHEWKEYKKKFSDTGFTESILSSWFRFIWIFFIFFFSVLVMNIELSHTLYIFIYLFFSSSESMSFVWGPLNTYWE